MKQIKQLWRHTAQFSTAIAKSRVTWASAFLATIVAAPVLEHAGWASAGSIMHGAGAATAVDAPDPLAAFDKRSPGARGAGGMVQTKNRLAVGTSAAKPHERVLPNVRYAPPGLIPGLLNDIIPSSLIDNYPPPSISPPPGQPFPPVVPVPIPPFAPGPPGTPTPPPGPPTPPVIPPPPVVPAVPEPATWAMLMIGMFVIGAGLRSTQRRLTHPRASLEMPRNVGGKAIAVTANAD